MTKPRLKSVYYDIVGDLDKISSERYFVTIVSLVASIFLLILCIVHIIMSLKIAPVFLAGSSSVIMLGLYYFVRFRSCLFIPKIILTTAGLIMLDFTWYSKFLSNGPVLFFILIFAALVIWVWEGRQLAFVLVLYFLNMAVLAIIDSQAPEILFRYPAPGIRTIDIYLSFFFYSALLIFLLYVVKKEFTRQKENALKSDRLKSAFLANMSHEIRTPMNSIVGFSQLLSNNSDALEKEQFISIIQNSSENLLRLINDIIDLSKIEAGDMDLKLTDVSLRELLFEIKECYIIELTRKGKENIRFDLIFEERELFIVTDKLRLKQILSNLLNNAVKFTSHGSITLSCEKKKNELIFSVKDTGTGIPEEDQMKIFERFVKFDYQGLNKEGSGIGLSIVKKLISIINGRLWFNSTLGEGSCFYFAIPYVSSTGYSGSINKSNASKSHSKSAKPKPILIVEDDDASTMLIKEILRPLNAEVHHVTDGCHAIDFARFCPELSVILMDLKLPTVNGYEATKAIKQINPGIHIIAQTAYAMLGDDDKAKNAGFDNYITKPLDIKKLQDMVMTYLQ